MNEQREENIFEEEGIDFLELLESIWQHKLMIILLVLAGAFVTFAKIYYLMPDAYTSSGILYISNKKEAVSELQTIQKQDIDTSRSLSATCIEILKTTSFLDEITQDVREYTQDNISGMINISAINETELLRVTATAPTAQAAYKISDSILQKAPGKLMGIYKNGEVEIVDPPKMPIAPDDKGIVLKTCIGALMGFFLGVLILFVRSFFDTKVRSAEAAAKRYNVSILGELPE